MCLVICGVRWKGRASVRPRHDAAHGWGRRPLHIERESVTDFHSGEPLSEHPTAEDVAAYLSGTLTPADQAAVEEHLAECRECRGQVVSARRVLRRHAAPNRRVWLLPGAAAAAVLLLAIFFRAPSGFEPGPEPVRSGQGAAGGDAGSRIPVLAPADGDTLAVGSITFVWRGQSGKPLFQFTLTDGSGRAVWTGATTDTTLTLPGAVSLDRGRTYFWTVDALSADGRSLTTRNHRFSTRP